MAMSLNMILFMFVIPCILSYDFNKLPILYIHVQNISFISMTNKYVNKFFLSIKYLSVCPVSTDACRDVVHCSSPIPVFRFQRSKIFYPRSLITKQKKRKRFKNNVESLRDRIISSNSRAHAKITNQ